MRKVTPNDPFYGLGANDVRRREYCPISEIDNVIFDGARSTNLVIENVHLPYQDQAPASHLWNIECRGGRVSSILLASEPLKPTSFAWSKIDGKGGLLIPSFVARILFMYDLL
jgi:hypothetical protein